MLRCVIYARDLNEASARDFAFFCSGSCAHSVLGRYHWFWCRLRDPDDVIECLIELVSSGFSPVAIGSLSGSVRVLPFSKLIKENFKLLCAEDTMLEGLVGGFVNVPEMFSTTRLTSLVANKVAGSLEVKRTPRGRLFVRVELRKSVRASFFFDIGIRIVEPVRLPPDPPGSV